MGSEPYRLPPFHDLATGRKVRLSSGWYTVLVKHGDRVSSAGNWPDLAAARKCARGLANLGEVLVVKPAGILDDDDFFEEVSNG